MNEDPPTELDLLYEDLRKAQQRITELEAEVAHYKQWLKERTAELERTKRYTKTNRRVL